VNEGIRAYIACTDAERKKIVESFQRAKGELPVRRNTYVDAAKLVLANRQQRRQQSLWVETRHRGAAAVTKRVEKKRVMIH
jgi:hypothetical protein